MVTYVNVPGLIILILTIIAVGVILLIVQKRKNERIKIVQDYSEKCGWKFERIKDAQVSGFRISEKSWEMEVTRDSSKGGEGQTGSSSIGRYTVWWSREVAMPSGIVLVGPKSPVPDLGGIGDFVRQTALKIMIGSEAEYTEGIKEVEFSRAELNPRYMIWTNREEMSQRMLTLEVENALINLPPKLPLVIKFTPLYLEVKVMDQCFEKPEEIVMLVKLGEALLRALR